jgi:hypothetical protein
MIGKVFDALFGCWHQHYGFPITIRGGKRRNSAASLTGTYVVCLDCGKELPYDWAEMRVVAPSVERIQHAQSLAAKEAA